MLKMDDNKNLIEKMGKDMKDNSHKKYKIPIKHMKKYSISLIRWMLINGKNVRLDSKLCQWGRGQVGTLQYYTTL